MKRCPITYEMIDDDEQYSKRGLRLLSKQLETLNPIPLTKQEQHYEAIARAGKMSVQGVQIKLSAVLDLKQQSFNIVDSHGGYILKPQSAMYPELPENEAITMSLAATIGIIVPVHGLVYSKDNSMTYFIKRFDRLPGKKKLAVEDFAQLSGYDRETKYKGSMEKVASVIKTYCTYPKVEFIKLLRLTLFNFLTGNEDMHLKNFSLITRDEITTLSPAYDLLNSTIATNHPIEEMALPLKGRKNNITKSNLFEYFSKEILELNQTVIDEIIGDFQSKVPIWREMIGYSFLSDKKKGEYLKLLDSRLSRIEL